MRKFDIQPDEITEIVVFTFKEATRLNCRRPKNTEEAQYSLPFPLAAAAFNKSLGVETLSGKALKDERILMLAERITLVEDNFCNAQFPKSQMAHVRIDTKDGKTWATDPVESPWDNSKIHQPEQPPDEELRQKYQWLVSGALSKSRAYAIEDIIWHCEKLPNAKAFAELLYDG
jgi:2-methylcitrate dehydratase PrpD